MDDITLFTSDSRPKYVNDALSVLALPQGSGYQFRYDTKYFPPSIQTLFETERAAGLRLLIAFRSEPKVVGENSVIVPLRWARLSSVERIADFFVIRFTVQGYPSFRNNKIPADRSELEKLAEDYVRGMNPIEASKPVHEGLTSLVETIDKNEKNTWVVIAKTLALHSIFSEIHFLRISEPRDARKVVLARDRGGRFQIKEGKHFHLPIDYFANAYADHEALLEVISDGQTLRIASCGKVQLDSRYDAIRVRFQARDVSGSTRSEIQVQTSGGKNKLPQTIVRIPVVVRNSTAIILLRTVVSGVGAFMIAMPGLLGPNTDLGLRGAIAGTGALLVSLGLNVIGRLK